MKGKKASLYCVGSQNRKVEKWYLSGVNERFSHAQMGPL